MAYFLGRGCVYIGERNDSGLFLAAQEFHCPEFEIDVSDTEYVDHDNTCDAIATRDLHVVSKFAPKVTMKIDTYDPALLAIALGGEITEKTSGASFSAKAFPSVTINNVYPVPGGYSNLESLVITDSAGTPATLTAGTHYTVDLVKGLVTILNKASFTEPFKAAGAELDDWHAISIGTDATVEKFIRFSGVNIADDNETVTVDVYRCSLDATKFMPKSSGNEIYSFDFSGVMLRDSNAPFSEDFGTYGRMIKG